MEYSSSSLSEKDPSSLLEIFLDLRASDLYFSFLLLEISESFSCFMDSIQASGQSSVSCDVVDESFGPSDTALTEEIVSYEHESDETQAVKRSKSAKQYTNVKAGNFQKV
ncbi:hypothetical protein Tco_0535136 [Tanacetum coccineum]